SAIARTPRPRRGRRGRRDDGTTGGAPRRTRPIDPGWFVARRRPVPDAGPTTPDLSHGFGIMGRLRRIWATTRGERMLPLLSGVLLFLSFPPAKLLVPPFVALVPFLLFVSERPIGSEGRWSAA